MSKKNIERILVSLDIGTSLTKVLVGLKSENKPIEIIGVGTEISKGLKKGNVIDIEAVSDIVLSSIESAEEMADVEIDGVFLNVSGFHIKSFNSNGSVPIKNEIHNFEITEENAENAISAAKAVSIPMDRMVLHVLSQEFAIDGQRGVRDPVGMSGVKLEVEVHIITALIAAVNNMVKCLGKANLKHEEIIINSLASATATLLPEEKEMGVVLIDIGAGVSDIAIYIHGSLKYSDVFPSGGDHVSSDIATALRIPLNMAEDIKIGHGSALRSVVLAADEFLVPGVVGRESRKMAKRELSSIIEARVEETFLLIKKKIQASGLSEKIGSGIVLTGGGSLLKDIDKLANRVFNVPVRVGRINGVEGIDDVLESPAFATSAGLLMYGGAIEKQQESGSLEKKRVFHLFIDFIKKAFDKHNM